MTFIPVLKCDLNSVHSERILFLLGSENYILKVDELHRCSQTCKFTNNFHRSIVPYSDSQFFNNFCR